MGAVIMLGTLVGLVVLIFVVVGRVDRHALDPDGDSGGDSGGDEGGWHA
jgi:hypothetical protein